jgi:hypothetical protein
MCGQTILQQNFDQFAGAYKSLTENSARSLWPSGSVRKSADGKSRATGLTGTIGISRLQVGQKQCKVEHAKGGITNRIKHPFMASLSA